MCQDTAKGVWRNVTVGMNQILWMGPKSWKKSQNKLHIVDIDSFIKCDTNW